MRLILLSDRVSWSCCGGDVFKLLQDLGQCLVSRQLRMNSFGIAQLLFIEISFFDQHLVDNTGLLPPIGGRFGAACLDERTALLPLISELFGSPPASPLWLVAKKDTCYCEFQK